MNGFRAASLDTILAAAGVTKGALYHHFGSKQGLGYAVVEEKVKPLVRERYIDPFIEADDPTEGLKTMGLRMEQELSKTGILLLGCPVNNLVTEMSGVDEGFRCRLAEILEEWKDTICEGLSMYVASYQGACGFAKNAHDIEPFTACRTVLDAHLETLRPEQASGVH